MESHQSVGAISITKMYRVAGGGDRINVIKLQPLACTITI